MLCRIVFCVVEVHLHLIWVITAKILIHNSAISESHGMKWCSVSVFSSYQLSFFFSASLALFIPPQWLSVLCIWFVRCMCQTWVYRGVTVSFIILNLSDLRDPPSLGSTPSGCVGSSVPQVSAPLISQLYPLVCQFAKHFCAESYAVSFATIKFETCFDIFGNNTNDKIVLIIRPMW